MNIYLLILLMTAVTYLPRLMPFLMIHPDRVPKWMNRVLRHIPHAALGALLIPGSLAAVDGQPVVSLVGMGLAALLFWFRVNIVLTMGIVVLVLWPLAAF